MTKPNPDLNSEVSTSERRGFLSKLLIGSTVLPVMASAVIAAPQKDGKGQKGRGRKGAQGTGGKPGERGPKGRERGQQRDPADMATRLLEQFDKDGDGKLNLQELTNALKSMQERRGSLATGDGTPAGKGPGPGGKGKGKAGAGGKKKSGEGILGGQGVKPNKPGQ